MIANQFSFILCTFTISFNLLRVRKSIIVVDLFITDNAKSKTDLKW